MADVLQTTAPTQVTIEGRSHDLGSVLPVYTAPHDEVEEQL